MEIIMKIYDITQELIGGRVFPGDPSPRIERIMSIDSGDVCNLSAAYMCLHNATHVDAPFHFISDGDTVEKIPLEYTVGYAYVCEHNGVLSGDDAEEVLSRAADAQADCFKRILLKGSTTVSADAARVFAAGGVLLVGNESQTVGPEDAPMEVHLTLLGAKVVLLEGIRLTDIPVGVYLLCAAPLLVGGADGAPCRAVLIQP